MGRHVLSPSGLEKWQTMTLAVVQGTLHYLAHMPLTSQYRSSYYHVQPKADIYAASSNIYILLTVLSCKKRWARGFFLGFFGGGGEMAVSMIVGHVC